KFESKSEPKPGQFEIIDRAHLPKILGMATGLGQGGGPGRVKASAGGARQGGKGKKEDPLAKGVQPGKPPEEGEKKGGTITRAGQWTPLGDLVLTSFTGGVQGINKGNDKEKEEERKEKATGKPLQLVRSEFVIFFVWDEPTPSEKGDEGGPENQ